nr:aminotransferase class IV [Candidatus Krumholzibacteria bacterium]
MIIFSNGRFHDDQDPAVPQDCGAFLHGHGVFTTMRLFQGDPRHLDEHARRLAEHAQALGLPPCPHSAILGAIIKELVQRNSLKRVDARLRITWTMVQGKGWLGLVPGPLPEELERWQKEGISVITLGPDFGRVFRPHLKSVNYLPSMLALKEAEAAAGCPEALVFDAQGDLLEGAISNVFVVDDGTVMTPPDDGRILAGLTRQAVLRRLEQLELSHQEAHLHRDRVLCAQEVFLTNSVREIVPVIRIDGRQVGTGLPGPLTRTIQKSFR